MKDSSTKSQIIMDKFKIKNAWVLEGMIKNVVISIITNLLESESSFIRIPLFMEIGSSKKSKKESSYNLIKCIGEKLWIFRK